MSGRKDTVTCPVCERQVPESEINLHLDLRCPGTPAGPSSPLSQPTPGGTQRSVVDLTQKEQTTPSASRPPAPMFRSRPSTQAQANGKGAKRPAPPDKGREEKKPRVNALKANQP